MQYEMKPDDHSEISTSGPVGAQQKSVFCVELAWMMSPSALTTSMANTISHPNPHFREFHIASLQEIASRTNSWAVARRKHEAMLRDNSIEIRTACSWLSYRCFCFNIKAELVHFDQIYQDATVVQERGRSGVTPGFGTDAHPFVFGIANTLCTCSSRSGKTINSGNLSSTVYSMQWCSELSRTLHHPCGFIENPKDPLA